MIDNKWITIFGADKAVEEAKSFIAESAKMKKKEIQNKLKEVFLLDRISHDDWIFKNPDTIAAATFVDDETADPAIACLFDYVYSSGDQTGSDLIDLILENEEKYSSVLKKRIIWIRANIENNLAKLVDKIDLFLEINSDESDLAIIRSIISRKFSLMDSLEYLEPVFEKWPIDVFEGLSPILMKKYDSAVQFIRRADRILLPYVENGGKEVFLPKLYGVKGELCENFPMSFRDVKSLLKQKNEKTIASILYCLESYLQKRGVAYKEALLHDIAPPAYTILPKDQIDLIIEYSEKEENPVLLLLVLQLLTNSTYHGEFIDRAVSLIHKILSLDLSEMYKNPYYMSALSEAMEKNMLNGLIYERGNDSLADRQDCSALDLDLVFEKFESAHHVVKNALAVILYGMLSFYSVDGWNGFYHDIGEFSPLAHVSVAAKAAAEKPKIRRGVSDLRSYEEIAPRAIEIVKGGAIFENPNTAMAMSVNLKSDSWKGYIAAAYDLYKSLKKDKNDQ